MDREVRAILAGMPLLDLDAEPVRDPGAMVMRLAAWSESGFTETAKRIDSSIAAGREPAEADVALLKLFGNMARQLGTDMTRLQIGVQLASQYGTASQNGAVEPDELDGVVQGQIEAPVPQIAEIVQSVMIAEMAAETDRVVKVAAVNAQSQPGPLHVVEPEAEAS